MNTSILVILSLVLTLWTTHTFSIPFTGSCDSCGRECQSACGTRGFRTCCLNYMKKRSTSMSGSEMKLELVMAIPELVQYYPTLRSFMSNKRDQSKLKTLFEIPEMKSSEYEE